MTRVRCWIIFLILVAPSGALSADPDSQSYTLASRRQVDHIDHVNIALEASGDVLSRSNSGEKPQRQGVNLSYNRDYDERTLQLPSATDKAARSVRYYQEASASLKKGSVAQSPALRPESRLVGVEILGGKETLFSPKGSFNWDDLDLVSTVGESLPLDQLLPEQAVRIGQSWKPSDEAIALLLALDEITLNSVQVTLKEATPELRGWRCPAESRDGSTGLQTRWGSRPSAVSTDAPGGSTGSPCG